MDWIEIPGNQVINLRFIKSIQAMHADECSGNRYPHVAFRSATIEFVKEFETFEEALDYYEYISKYLRALQHED